MIVKSRERIQAAMMGEEADRFPVWLKMANSTWRLSQPEPYRSMNEAELLSAAGCDLMLGCPYKPLIRENSHITIDVANDDGTRRTTMHTPDGVLMGEERIDPATNSSHPSRFMVKTRKQLAMLRWFYTDANYTVDESTVEETASWQQRMIESDGFTNSGIGPSPLMHLIEHICGPMQTIYLMKDEPELFREVVELMHTDRMNELRTILPHLPVDAFWLTENTSTTLISPEMFRDICIPQLSDYGSCIREYGIAPVHHMCGSLNALLEMIDTLPAAANEAYTTRPLGDVSLEEGRRRMPSKTLIGGTNATLWMAPVEKIIETVAADLTRCPDKRRIFLTSAGVLPPVVSFDKARRVVDQFKKL